MESVKKHKTELTELPDYVISHIFSMLNLKTLLKTSALSKQWYHEWGLRKDLNFDIHNMFDCNTMPELPKTLPLLKEVQSQFVTRLDDFMLKYPGDMISSIRVNFPLGHDHTDVINRLIHKGVLKSVNRIELLFACEFRDTDDSDTDSDSDSDDDDIMEPYQFMFPFLSDTDSLTYLHLQNCHIAAPMEYFGLKNLRTLVLHLVPLKQNMLQDLFLNCIHLENFTLNECTLRSDLKIISPTLLHLNVKCADILVNRRNIDIIASNLSSIEYSSYFRSSNFRNSNYGYSERLHRVNIKSHMLSKFSCSSGKISKFVDFSQLKNVTTMVLEGLNECLQTKVIPHLFSKDLRLEDVTFKNCKFSSDLKIISPKLRHLGIINCCDKSCYSYKKMINIVALNLSSFEYRGYKGTVFVEAPKLLKVFWDGGVRKYSVYNFARIARLHHVENLAMTTHYSQIPKLTKHLVGFQNLRQLEFFISGTDDPNKDYFWILDIVMASQNLQKLSLTIKNEHTEKSHIIGSDRQKREYAGLFHNDLKYVKLHGCVCSSKVIELANHLLRSAKSLKQISFSSRDYFYIGAGRWTESFNGCCWFDRNLIYELLKDEVNEQCELIIS